MDEIGRRRQLVPNMITAFSLMCGLFIIFKTNMTEVGGSTYESLRSSAILLLVAAFADLLDGAVARAIRATSRFGGIFDSLADAITFGVVPSVVMLKSLSLQPGTPISFVATSGAMVYSVSGVLRLVRFSAKPSDVEDDAEVLESMKNFTGLPIPAAACASVSLNLFLISPLIERLWLPSQMTRACVLSFAMMLVGYFMISRWKFPSLKSLQFRFASFQILLTAVVSVVFVLFGLLYHFPTAFFAVSWLYLVVAWGLSLCRMFAGSRSRVLEDFEPEPEMDDIV